MQTSFRYPSIFLNIGCFLYCQSAEEVDFSGNAITAVGIEAFDGILQINTALKSLNLSGNDIGDEGAKVF
jgi:Ran GTPase-activating protein (RanGAP) involved in mRNA processing and transport